MKFGNNRKDYISWDDYYMGIALLSAKRSKDPSTQVGACIVGEDKRILSIGYNGTPNMIDDEEFNWSRDGELIDTKYPFVIHAEINAILNYTGDASKFKGASVYVTLFPCNECAKTLAQRGITRVVYLSDKYADTESSKLSKAIFDRCGITYDHYDGDINKIFA